jgi:hypothetical protein
MFHNSLVRAYLCPLARAYPYVDVDEKERWWFTTRTSCEQYVGPFCEVKNKKARKDVCGTC